MRFFLGFQKSTRSELSFRAITSFCFLGLLLALVPGCAEKATQEVQATSYEPLLPPEGIQDTRWSSKGEVVVARVGKVEIMAEDVQAVLSAGLAKTPREALDVALETEALAQWATESRNGETLPGTSAIRYRQALVQRLLQYRFEEQLTPDTVPFDYIKSAFWAPSIRKRYIHFDAFNVRDIQYLCCLSVSECNHEPESRESCFAEGKKFADELFAQLQDTSPKSAQEFIRFAETKMKAVHSHFSLHEFSVFYDVKASYDENTRVDRATREVMETLLTMKEHDFHEPVRDLFGWHIMFLVHHEPEKQKKPEDPDVRKEIAEGIYSRVQEQELMKFLGQELMNRKIEIRAPELRALAQQAGSANQ